VAKNQIIIIPTFNELNSLKKVINSYPKNWNILVVDDCSKDKTINFLKKNKIQYVKNKHNLGYEKSILRGFNYALKFKKFRYVATLDSDGEHNPKYLKKMLKIMIEKNLDMVIAERSNYNRISEKIIGKIYKFKFNISDPLSGYKLYKKESLNLVLKKIKTSFFLVDIINLFKLNSGKIKSLPIISKKRNEGKPKVGSSFFVNLKILMLIILFIYY